MGLRLHLLYQFTASTISKTDRVMGAAFPPSSIADTPWVGLHTHPQPLPAGGG